MLPEPVGPRCGLSAACVDLLFCHLEMSCCLMLLDRRVERLLTGAHSAALGTLRPARRDGQSGLQTQPWELLDSYANASCRGLQKLPQLQESERLGLPSALQHQQQDGGEAGLGRRGKVAPLLAQDLVALPPTPPGPALPRKPHSVSEVPVK